LRIPPRENKLSDDERVRFTEMSRWAAHVTTLSAGSIVIIATFAEKFEGRGPGFLLAIAAVGFAATIVAGLATAQFTIWKIGVRGNLDLVIPMLLSLLVTCVAFVIALVSLASFAAIAVT
jgi:hypothetical protein